MTRAISERWNRTANERCRNGANRRVRIAAVTHAERYLTHFAFTSATLNSVADAHLRVGARTHSRRSRSRSEGDARKGKARNGDAAHERGCEMRRAVQRIRALAMYLCVVVDRRRSAADSQRLRRVAH